MRIAEEIAEMKYAASLEGKSQAELKKALRDRIDELLDQYVCRQLAQERADGVEGKAWKYAMAFWAEFRERESTYYNRVVDLIEE